VQIFDNLGDPRLVELIKDGRVGVIRTDTLYGLIAQASNIAAVERVYALKHRDSHKPSIILISQLDTSDLPQPYEPFLRSVWPGRNSVILPAPDAPDYLTRGGGSLAYRMPDSPELLNLINQTGPLIAPSANTQGEAPAANLEQAVSYFGDTIDFYVDGGEVVDMTPSALYRLATDGGVERLR